jgi:hypothetical protein
LVVHNKRHTYDPKQPLTAWVQAIARYKLVDLMRRRSRGDLLTDLLDEDDQVFATTASDAAEAQYDVAKLLRGLSARGSVHGCCVGSPITRKLSHCNLLLSADELTEGRRKSAVLGAWAVSRLGTHAYLHQYFFRNRRVNS